MKQPRQMPAAADTTTPPLPPTKLLTADAYNPDRCPFEPRDLRQRIRAVAEARRFGLTETEAYERAASVCRVRVSTIRKAMTFASAEVIAFCSNMVATVVTTQAPAWVPPPKGLPAWPPGPLVKLPPFKTYGSAKAPYGSLERWGRLISSILRLTAETGLSLSAIARKLEDADPEGKITFDMVLPTIREHETDVARRYRYGCIRHHRQQRKLRNRQKKKPCTAVEATLVPQPDKLLRALHPTATTV